MVELYLTIVHETEDAYLLTDGDIQDWFPKSQIQTEEDGGIGDSLVFEIPIWLAEEKEFV